MMHQETSISLDQLDQLVREGKTFGDLTWTEVTYTAYELYLYGLFTWHELIDAINDEINSYLAQL